jgi:hypothetical protein
MVDLEMDSGGATKEARVLLNELEVEGLVEPRLLHAVQLLTIAVEELAAARQRSCRPSSTLFAGR